MIDYTLLKKLGFHSMNPPKILGKGAFGAVELFDYQGNDPSFLKMCDEKGRIAIKFQNKFDENELRIALYLSSMSRDYPNEGLDKINLTNNIVHENQVLGIATKFEYVTLDLEGVVEDVGMDMGRFLSAKDPDFDVEDQEVKQAFDQNMAIMLSQIASSNHSSQHALHQQGVFHFDTALRNFLVNIRRDDEGQVIGVKGKIADYGFSQVYRGADSIAIPEGMFLPLRHLNQETLRDREASIKTDLYALRISMLSMVGLASSSTPSNEVQFIKFGLPDIDKDNTQFAMYKARMNDKATLQIILKQVEKSVAEECKDNPEKKAEIDLFLSCYKDYILSLPKTHDFKEAQEEDKKKMTEANNLFVRRSLEMMDKRRDSKRNPAQYRLSLMRLQQIDGIDTRLQHNIALRISSISYLDLRNRTEKVSRGRSITSPVRSSPSQEPYDNGYVRRPDESYEQNPKRGRSYSESSIYSSKKVSDYGAFSYDNLQKGEYDPIDLSENEQTQEIANNEMSNGYGALHNDSEIKPLNKEKEYSVPDNKVYDSMPDNKIYDSMPNEKTEAKPKNVDKSKPENADKLRHSIDRKPIAMPPSRKGTSSAQKTNSVHNDVHKAQSQSQISEKKQIFQSLKTRLKSMIGKKESTEEKPSLTDTRCRK